jgi:hypothetical protein
VRHDLSQAVGILNDPIGEQLDGRADRVGRDSLEYQRLKTVVGIPEHGRSIASTIRWIGCRPRSRAILRLEELPWGSQSTPHGRQFRSGAHVTQRRDRPGGAAPWEAPERRPERTWLRGPSPRVVRMTGATSIAAAVMLLALTMMERMAVRELEHLPWGRRNRLGLAGARMSQAVMSTSSAPVATVETLDVSCREPQAEDGPGVV